MDQFDVVRAYYRALNERDVDRAAALYDASCVTERIFFEDDEDVRRGREVNRDRLAAFLNDYDGAFDDGNCYHVRTIAGIETGWGWVQADWTQRVRMRPDGAVRQFRGYSHFLIEDGLIRRHRSVTREVDATDVPTTDESRDTRHYPTRPVVGIGAVILVSPSDGARLGWPNVPDGGGIVLIKRRYEPLAGQWSLPGGGLEVGEILEAGVAREIAEETGLAVDVGPVVDVFDRILLDQDRRVRYHFVLIDYLCRPRGGQLRAGSDVADVTIADPDRLEPYELTAKAQDVIRRAMLLKIPRPDAPSR